MVARTALICLNPVIVVTGAWQKEIQDALSENILPCDHGSQS